MIPNSELIHNADGSIYHLNLCREDVARRIILVGDQARVDKVATYFTNIRTRIQHREFYTVTGIYGKHEYSVISSGIGTDNIDIVLNELDALFNLDEESGKPVPRPEKLKILRFGTCGGMQPDLPVGSLVLSNYAIGGDGLLGYYHLPGEPALQESIDAFWAKHLRKLPRFFGEAASNIFIEKARQFPEIYHGGTFSAAGFYAPQGRSLGRARAVVPNLPQIIAGFRFRDMPVLNMEMETSAILGLGAALGHEAGSLSVILANRQRGEFAPNPQAEEAKLIEAGLALFESAD
ncbi:MAG: nucleoside phosphorylase [Bacteroidia bacterium]